MTMDNLPSFARLGKEEKNYIRTFQAFEGSANMSEAEFAQWKKGVVAKTRAIAQAKKIITKIKNCRKLNCDVVKNLCQLEVIMTDNYISFKELGITEQELQNVIKKIENEIIDAYANNNGEPTEFIDEALANNLLFPVSFDIPVINIDELSDRAASNIPATSFAAFF